MGRFGSRRRPLCPDRSRGEPWRPWADPRVGTWLTLNRDELAAFVSAQGPLLLRRIRRKLSPSARDLFDSQDVFSTMLRRVDKLAAQGRLRAESEAQLVALLTAIVDHAVIDRARISERKKRVERRAAQSARADRKSVVPEDSLATHSQLDVLNQLITDPADRELLRLRLQGASFSNISEATGKPEGTLRWRWGRLGRYLRDHVEQQ